MPSCMTQSPSISRQRRREWSSQQLDWEALVLLVKGTGMSAGNAAHRMLLVSAYCCFSLLPNLASLNMPKPGTLQLACSCRTGPLDQHVRPVHHSNAASSGEARDHLSDIQCVVFDHVSAGLAAFSHR